MEEEEIKEMAMKMITHWLLVAFVLILCGLGWWKFFELASKILGE